MRTFFFFFVCLCGVAMTNAQIILSEDFGNWQDGIPVNWTLYNLQEVATVEITPVADRNGEVDKACRIHTIENNRDGSTWHVTFRNVDDLFVIEKGTEYYYTFWAKSDVEGTELWIGLEENYDQTHVVGGDWWKMPKIQLTTEWKQYKYKEVALANQVKRFSIQLRTPGILYIDDIHLKGMEVEKDMAIDAIAIDSYAANSLSEVERLSLTGAYDETNFETLKAALANNQSILSITMEETAVTDFSNVDYFTDINPNCLKFVPAGVSSDLPNFVSQSIAISRIELTDGKPFECVNEIISGAEGIVYTRDCYVDGGWETIALPFEINNLSELTDFRIEKLIGQKENEDILLFEVIKEWRANEPYIMSYIGEDKGDTRLVEFTAGENVPIKTINVDPTFIFKANYNASVSAEGLYILNPDGSAFGKGSDKASIPPFRAYMEFNNQDNASPRFSLQHENGTTGMNIKEKTNNIYSVNGILYINSSDNRNITIYNLDGRKVLEKSLSEGINTIDGLVNGIYVVSNQKVIIK